MAAARTWSSRRQAARWLQRSVLMPPAMAAVKQGVDKTAASLTDSLERHLRAAGVQLIAGRGEFVDIDESERRIGMQRSALQQSLQRGLAIVLGDHW